MSGAASDVAGRYAAALHAALADEGDEGALSAAYDVGRDAMRQGLSVLDLATIHTDALAGELAATPRHPADRTVRAAGNFFLESLSAYEMLARVMRQSRDVARLEQHHAQLLRQLSGFLADASLAVDAHASLQEVLQLVAEHALEVVEADACTARLSAAGDGVLEVEALASTVESRGDVRDRLTELCAAPFTALDGREVGTIRLFTLADDRPSSAVDEAVTLQLAQMASATFERMDRYRR
jgi:hypothetical protein